MVVPPAEYSEVQFETRLASYSDSERNSLGDDDGKGKGKRESRPDDAWVDILVNSQSRRIVGQDVDPTATRKATGGDPDMASLEVAQVLAAVRGQRDSEVSLGSFDDEPEVDEDDFLPQRRAGGGSEGAWAEY